MKILGIGVDITKNKRVNHLIKNKNFVDRIFSKNEIDYFKKNKSKKNYFSKRFAAKESLAKAIGTGFRKGLNFKDIEVKNDTIGKPYFALNKKIKNFILKNMKIRNFDLFLSISDEKDYSIAFTIILNKNVK